MSTFVLKILVVQLKELQSKLLTKINRNTSSISLIANT